MSIQIILLRLDPNTGRMYHKHPDGFAKGLVAPNIDYIFANSGETNERLRKANPDNLVNAFYTVGHHTGLGKAMPERTKLSYESQSILQFDLDHVDMNRAWDYLLLTAKILGVLPQSLILNSTGNGLHVIAHLKTPIRSSKYLEETKPNYNEVVYRINQALKDHGLPGNADPAVWDAPRILRLPNTINEKKGVRKEAVLLQYPGLLPLDLDIVKLSGLDLLQTAHILPAALKKSYPRPDFQEVMTQCEFMKELVTKPDAVHEPQFQLALGLFGAMSPGDKYLDAETERSPKELAEKIFNSAENSASLARGQFETKWEHGIRYGAPRCQTISNAWVGGCERCPHFGKINTPLALKSVDHISSSQDGYWVRNQKGGFKHPHYSDLAKIYSRDHSYVTCEPERIFTFDQTHYKLTGQLTLKAWLEKRIGFVEELKDQHCTEFVKKILRSNALSERSEMELFETGIRGKINCRNGIVDIVKGELLPASPTFGFKYALPYDYVAGQASEFFLDWLSEMMLDRTDLMDAVLDLMAYALWPDYDDHVFAYFIGEGRNGKSTLLHILQELVGRGNYSAISLSQLGGNRFAPANLEGKLVNLSEESSGSDLTFDQVNVIKDLSAGGEIQVEHKGEKPFILRNRAKLFFSANKPPRFHEQGKALRSRLLAVPFDFTIERPDSTVERKLLGEVPKIFSMLVTRTQENVSANGGRFLVARAGNTGATAQDKMLLAGNSVVEWGKNAIESSAVLSEDDYVRCNDAFSKYKTWCDENNFKSVNAISFGIFMTGGVLNPAFSRSKIRKIGGKPVRVYPRTQWKEQIL